MFQPVGYGFDEQCVKAAADWEFKPAVDVDNRPVPVKYDYHIGIRRLKISGQQRFTSARHKHKHTDAQSVVVN